MEWSKPQKSLGFVLSNSTRSKVIIVWNNQLVELELTIWLTKSGVTGSWSLENPVSCLEQSGNLELRQGDLEVSGKSLKVRKSLHFPIAQLLEYLKLLGIKPAD